MTVSTVTGRPASTSSAASTARCREGPTSTGPAAVHTSTGPNSRNSMTTPRPSNIVVPGSDRVNGLWEHLAHHAGVVEERDVRRAPDRIDVYLERPAGGRRYERRPVLVGGDHPYSRSPFRREQVGHEAGAAAPGRREHPRGSGRDERQRVDLAVRVAQRHADLLAPVFEA